MFARTRVAGVIVACCAVLMSFGCQSQPEAAGSNGIIRQQQHKPVGTSRPQLASSNDGDLQPGPIQAQTYIAAARLHESQGRLLQAIQQYQAAAQEDPENVEVLARIGILYDRMGNGAAAEATYKQALRIAPQDARLLNNLAFNYIMRSQWAKAEAELIGALQIAPDFSRARVNLAMTLAQQGRFDEALEQFETVLPSADAHYNMGLMYQSKRKMVEAAEQYKLALQANPKLVAAEQQLKKIPSAVLSEADHRLDVARKNAELATEQALRDIENNSANDTRISAEARPATATQPAVFETAENDCDEDDAGEHTVLKIELVPLLSRNKAFAGTHAPARVTTTRPAWQEAVDESQIFRMDINAVFSDVVRNNYLGAAQASELDSLLPAWQRTPEVIAELAMDYSWIYSAGENHWLDSAQSPLPRVAGKAFKTQTFMSPSPSTQPE